MLKSVTYRLGPWTFVPSAHELRSATARVRLEQRASSTLSLLCEHGGEVVGRDEIIERAWGRRHLSPNSVAVVIGDLRRALGIAAGEPGSIETVPKAGYRLIGGEREARARRGVTPLAYGLLAIAVAVLIGVAAWPPQPARPEVVIGSIENRMGTDRYASLITACNQTVIVELAHYSGALRIAEAPVPAGERPDFTLQQRWVLWSGDPELVLVASDRSGRTVWSGAVYGSEDRFPAKISDEVHAFAALAGQAK
jgi:DNA-binding winged helix-turn-helix (wHTH) protein